MVLFWNMQVLSFLSRFLTSRRYQNGYYGCGGNQRYHYGRYAVLKRHFVSTKVRLRPNKSKGKKGEKMEKRAFKMDGKIFSSIKKHKKSNAIGFESVPLNIKIDVFLVKVEHTFSRFPH